MIYDNVVVGSGISALGCVIGLLKANKKVLCIDASKYNPEFININEKEKIIFCKQNLPLKNFDFHKKLKKIFDPVEVLESHSFGGLSNVWGSNCLRFLQSDFVDWPVSYNELKKYYDTCEKIMNVSHFDDEISKKLEIGKDVIDPDKLNLFSNFIKTFLNKKKSFQ